MITGDSVRITDQTPTAQRMSSVVSLRFREWIVLNVHDAPAFFVLAGILIRFEF
jgi:hypothetical protein